MALNFKKTGLFTLVGAILCLVSMALSYIRLSAIVISYGIRWANVARFANYVLYAVPVIGIIMLIAGLTDHPTLKLVSAVAALAFSVYYLIAYPNLLNGDVARYLAAANPLISSRLGISSSDISGALVILQPFTRIGLGAILFFAGTLCSVLGLFMNTSKTSSRTSSSDDDDGFYAEH